MTKITFTLNSEEKKITMKNCETNQVRTYRGFLTRVLTDQLPFNIVDDLNKTGKAFMIVFDDNELVSLF